MEADPRHAEVLAAMLGPGATPLSTPGVKESGKSRGRVYFAEQESDARVAGRAAVRGGRVC
eukprot:2598288-Lingulodinium_polyedra.AAC.1